MSAPGQMHQDWQDRVMAAHAKEVAKGLHDDECEYGRKLKLTVLMLCHCSKRRREREGFTTPPDEDLYFASPDCTRCHTMLEHDGDGWRCHKCSLSWDSNGLGHTCSFTDDYGELAR